MNRSDVVSALNLPESARVDQRVPKKLLLENGAPTASDKRLITDAIEDIQWLAALKPNTIGVPEYRDTQREYLEIAVLAVTLRGAIKPTSLSRLVELVHRAVPYPVLLLLVDEPTLILSLAHKRWAQNEAGKIVLDGDLMSASLPCTASGTTEADTKARPEAEHAFVQSLAIARQPQASLHALYQGWIECVQALHAARRTGSYQAAATPEQAAARRQALVDCQRLEGEISRLCTQAAKEKQLARQVELNLTLKRIQAELAAAQQQL
ncbi:DUF4391 domain-containing protein [Pseudomonas aeruginosa]|uniref:DUF4391 domain-containing protein n=1 Tax=Pseudomonadota TaxID=1224 RepID=UPI00053E3E4A|nr:MULTISPECIES: DUF4391 domain-containing protein [Pseudomonadota]ELI8871545.1 DUF4391 domain-containing protein [Pseudomonas aeruginosa]MCU9261020.1 DUF4391 domain-containing protein [Pseudomonas aeruginosa]HBP5594196.1 DUF4391 domain-containing protein [Pseudomonas aeruginosa]HBP5597026.1 DUF4391 domain-containing protein [Pseudomonas aeruginosa]HBP5632035.1 DUF4391 domain-containing protein [Pseudomonas aeruginosa]